VEHPGRADVGSCFGASSTRPFAPRLQDSARGGKGAEVERRTEKAGHARTREGAPEGERKPYIPGEWAFLLAPATFLPSELELELIQSQMAQKAILLRGDVGARSLRVRSVSREEAWASAGVKGAWVRGCGCEAD